MRTLLAIAWGIGTLVVATLIYLLLDWLLSGSTPHERGMWQGCAACATGSAGRLAWDAFFPRKEPSDG